MLKRAAVALLGLSVLLLVVASSGCGSSETAGERSAGQMWNVPVVSTTSLPQLSSPAPTPSQPSTPAGDEYEEQEAEPPPPVIPEPTTEPEPPTEPACPT